MHPYSSTYSAFQKQTNRTSIWSVIYRSAGTINRIRGVNTGCGVTQNCRFTPIDSRTRPGCLASGFTLLELMVVLAIVAILATLAAPSFSQLIKSSAISSAVNIFMSDMRYARSESIRRGGRVVLCRRDAPEALAPGCSSGSGAGEKGWVSGWIVFFDTDNDADKQADELLLRVQSPITGIDAIVEGGTGASTFLRFTATGRLLKPSSATSLQFGGDNYAEDVQRVLCVSPGGHVRIAGNGAALCPIATP